MILAIKSDIYKMLREKGFYISLIIGVLLSVWNLINSLLIQNNMNESIQKYGDEYLYTYYPVSVFNSYLGINNSSLQTNIFYMILPLLSVLPFSMLFFDERKSGYINLILTRTSKCKYYASKYIVSFFSGGLICLIILGFSLFLNAMFIPSVMPEVTTAYFPVAYEGSLWLNIYLTHPYLYILLYTLLDMLYCGIFAVLALSASFIFDYKITVFVFPFIIYLLSSYLFNTLGFKSGKMMSFLPQFQMKNENLNVILMEALIFIVLTILVMIISVVKDEKN